MGAPPPSQVVVDLLPRFVGIVKREPLAKLRAAAQLTGTCQGLRSVMRSVILPGTVREHRLDVIAFFKDGVAEPYNTVGFDKFRPISGLEVFHWTGSSLSNLPFSFGSLKSLRILYFLECPMLEDLTFLRSLPAHVGVSVVGCQRVRSLEGLEGRPYVKVEDCAQVDDLSPLASVPLVDLRDLPHVTDLAPIRNAEAVALRNLGRVADVAALRAVRRLEVSNMGALVRLFDRPSPQMETLRVSECPRLSELPPLGSLHRVTLVFQPRPFCANLHSLAGTKAVVLESNGGLLDLDSLCDAEAILVSRYNCAPLRHWPKEKLERVPQIFLRSCVVPPEVEAWPNVTIMAHDTTLPEPLCQSQLMEPYARVWVG